MKTPLTDTFCLMVGVRPARLRRPGEQFEAAPHQQVSRWIWRTTRILTALMVLIVMLTLYAR